MRIWRKRQDQDGLPVSVGDDPGTPRVIDLRERPSGWAVHEPLENHAASFPQLHEAADPVPHTTAPPWRTAPTNRLAAAYAARRGDTPGTQPTNSTSRQHDTTQLHDTTNVHDTSRVHDTARVHDATTGRHGIELRTPVARAAPQPSVPPEAPEPTQQVEPEGSTQAVPALSPGKRSAWDELDERLASIQRQLRPSEIVATTAPTAPAPAPAPEQELAPEPEPALEPPAVGSPPTRPRLGRFLVLTATVVVCLLLAVAAGLAIRTASDDGSPEPTGLTRQQSSQLAGWLRANTREGAVIAAPSDLRPELEAALRDRQVVTIEDDPDQATDLVVLPRGWQPALPGLAVASLGTRTRTFDVLEPRRDAASVEAELARRVEAGRRLVASVNLRLTPRAWTMLANGKVDLSVASLLRRLLRTHTVEVSSFPRDPLATAAGAPARTVDITSLDGATPDAGLIQTVRAPGTRTHVGRDRGRPALVVHLPIAGQG
jgi:hypothetical protein